jgi:hypothetical protein
MLGGPNRKQDPSDCRDRASPGHNNADMFGSPMSAQRFYGREIGSNLLILHERFSPQSGKKLGLFNVGPVTLNQRVPGSSPGAPTKICPPNQVLSRNGVHHAV